MGSREAARPPAGLTHYSHYSRAAQPRFSGGEKRERVAPSRADVPRGAESSPFRPMGSTCPCPLLSPHQTLAQQHNPISDKCSAAPSCHRITDRRVHHWPARRPGADGERSSCVLSTSLIISTQRLTALSARQQFQSHRVVVLCCAVLCGSGAAGCAPRCCTFFVISDYNGALPRSIPRTFGGGGRRDETRRIVGSHP